VQSHCFGVDLSEARFVRSAGQSIIDVRDEEKVLEDSKVDELVPHTQDVNLIIVRQRFVRSAGQSIIDVRDQEKVGSFLRQS
jgi:hypothetical protein